MRVLIWEGGGRGYRKGAQNTRIHIPKNKTNNILGLFFDFLLNTILNKISGVFLIERGCNGRNQWAAYRWEKLICPWAIIRH